MVAYACNVWQTILTMTQSSPEVAAPQPVPDSVGDSMVTARSKKLTPDELSKVMNLIRAGTRTDLGVVACIGHQGIFDTMNKAAVKTCIKCPVRLGCMRMSC